VETPEFCFIARVCDDQGSTPLDAKIRRAPDLKAAESKILYDLLRSLSFAIWGEHGTRETARSTRSRFAGSFPQRHAMASLS
jgi:hypothetical protein